MKKNRNIWALLLSSTLLLCSCGGQSESAKAAQAAIDALPESYSDSVDGGIDIAKSLYDALPDKDKSTVNAEKLNNLLKEKEEAAAESAKQAEQASAQAEELTGAVKKLKLSTSNANDLKKSAKALDEITKMLEDMPEDIKNSFDYSELNSKVSKCTEEATEHMDQLNSDGEQIVTAGEKHESAWDWANADNMPAAYSDMLEAAYALERVKLFDAKAAAQAAKTVSGDFEDFIVSTGNVDKIINDDNDFVSKRKALADKVVSELETYGDAFELYENSLKALTGQL